MKASLFFLIALFVTSCSHPQPIANRTSVLTGMAKDKVLSSLKAPSTAVFNDSLHSVTNLVNGEGLPSDQWRVYISVDAQNIYGAMLRNKYMLIYEQTGVDSMAVDSYVLNDFYN